MPEPAARITRARYRSGTASARANTISVASGSTLDFVTFGSLVPSHGLCAMTRSRIAARKMPETMPCTTPTVLGASCSAIRLAHA